VDKSGIVSRSSPRHLPKGRGEAGLPSTMARTALQRALGCSASSPPARGFMQFYNHERPHQGYRVRGRTPAALFWGAARA
jgi:hypothetical protein